MAKRRNSLLKKRKKKKVNTVNKESYFDYQLLFLVLFLAALGLIMIYSTSSYNAELQTGKAYFYILRQGIFGLLGIVAMLVTAHIDYHFWKKFSKVMMIAMFVLLLAVILLGKATNGSKRWIEIGSVRFQPSEIAKIVIILFTAHMATIKANRIKDFKIVIKVALWPMLLTALIAIENLSTAVICTAIIFMIIFVTSPKVKQFILLIIGAAGLLSIFMLASYRQDRIKAWRHPELYPDDAYQTLQSLYAIGSGGIFGKGLGQSVQKLGFIPESHNDMIFSVICEELGLFGAVCVIGLFALLIWRCVMISMSAPDLYGALIVVGVITHLAVQVLVNIAVVTNTFPNTGVPLPFISYGGTALFCLMIEIGLVLSVARSIHIPKEY